MKQLTRHQADFYKKITLKGWFTIDRLPFLSRPYFTLAKLEAAGYIESEVRCEGKTYTRYWRKRKQP